MIGLIETFKKTKPKVEMDRGIRETNGQSSPETEKIGITDFKERNKTNNDNNNNNNSNNKTRR